MKWVKAYIYVLKDPGQEVAGWVGWDFGIRKHRRGCG